MSSPPPYQSYGAPPQDTGQGPLGLAPNTFSMLCYAPCCIGLIFSIIGVAMEKSNRLIRFHSFQGLFLAIALIAISIVISLVFTGLQMVGGNSGGIIALVLLPVRLLLGVVFLGIMIYMMLQANGGKWTKLPIIGDLAEKQAS